MNANNTAMNTTSTMGVLSSSFGRGKHRAHLVSQRDCDDPLLERHADAGSWIEHETTEHLTATEHGELCSTRRELEATVLQVVLAAGERAAAIQALERGPERRRFESAVPQ